MVFLRQVRRSPCAHVHERIDVCVMCLGPKNLKGVSTLSHVSSSAMIVTWSSLVGFTRHSFNVTWTMSNLSLSFSLLAKSLTFSPTAERGRDTHMADGHLWSPYCGLHVTAGANIQSWSPGCHLTSSSKRTLETNSEDTLICLCRNQDFTHRQLATRLSLPTAPKTVKVSLCVPNLAIATEHKSASFPSLSTRSPQGTPPDLLGPQVKRIQAGRKDIESRLVFSEPEAIVKVFQISSSIATPVR
ncbi:hypothetical protein VFPPC_15622 [Pochonia chlamydosporia 170]|uniref:Uncharacterized protein n=1 Tax=Pochonia chlamydosporia 170 TaxID=1380566 RepID=A0A179FZK5_METCM|nr:hypothetical protein VFPPC_15622 [Pochonia chlamydosporia 170]OAQ70807.1 hypothetical protein VFPPC_15622 [Pochonia chlamydosporia 170]